MRLPKLDVTMQKKVCKPLMLGRVWIATRRAVSLEHSPHHQFGCCQWQEAPRPTVAYLIYRWLVFIGVVSVAIASFACQSLPRRYEGPVTELNYFKWFIYLTNWGLMLIALQSGLALLLVHRYRTVRNLNIGCQEEDGPVRRRRTPLICRLYWLAHTVATDLAFVITLVYWTLVHDPKMNEVNAINLLVHGGNTLVMLSELLVTTHPVRIAHALYGAGAGLVYGIFSAIYWALGGTDRIGHTTLYPALDWDHPGKAFGFVTLCAVVLVSAHALASGLAAVRVRVAARILPSYPHGERLTTLAAH